MLKILGSMICLLSFTAVGCVQVYTIGSYDEVFSYNGTVMKLGPLARYDVPPFIPESFLESDGTYAGGEVFCTVSRACTALKKQLASGMLPAWQTWYIYVLDAVWNRDVYGLKLDDYRLNRSVRVVKQAIEQCEKAEL